ncbi:MAG: hypothetical protein GF383_01830 [Candidatus Lokiarchaeota archaeon]|nr:hypothetical protein [Candidatus Lokiarchaeota archaeon]MBD3338084.1 hypothetical protein [Candidatus Lokiarchaeota archaeon]
MKEVRILSLDNRGRVVIPQIIRKSLGITSNSQLMMIADSETKTIKIIPAGFAGESLKFRITMRDEAGALGLIATTFGNHGISLVYGESVIVEKEKTAVWTVIGPKPSHISLEELKEILKTEGNALKVEIIPLG